MTQLQNRVNPQWLALRESADAAARSVELVDEIRRIQPAMDRLVIHDFACGSGSMSRWLAPRLAGPQHWVLYDWDEELLSSAAAGMPERSADGAAVTCEIRQRDVTRLESSELEGASLITASALLDMLTDDEIHRLVTIGVDAGCPVLLTISVIGRVELSPADPLDVRVGEAFNAHQRRTVDGRRLLGPDAVGVAAAQFVRRGAEVLTRPSTWQLGPYDAALAAHWFAGWFDAAVEQRPELQHAAADYACRRRDDICAGRLAVAVHHHDLLARPR